MITVAGVSSALKSSGVWKARKQSELSY